MKLNPSPRLAHGRAVPPAETVRRLEHALAGLGPHRYTEHQAAPDLFWGALESDLLQFPAMGKGASALLCRAATLAETTEWLALRRVRELPGSREAGQDGVPDAVTFESLLSHIVTASPGVLRRIKDLPRARRWVDGFSLTAGAPRSVPLEYVHALSGTNGLASGNTREEAILQGLLEVFERRAAITVVRQQLVMPTFDPATIVDPTLQRQLTGLRARGIEVVLKDLSFDGALPCVGVYFRDPQRPADFQSHHVFKVGASYDLTAALGGCLAEYAQTMRMGEADPGAGGLHERLLTVERADNFLPLFWFGYVPWRDADFLRDGDLVPFEPAPVAPDACDDIQRALTLAGRLGREVVVVELTDPALGFPVCQTILPGYSDILPYHPAHSPVLFTGWTRDLPLGEARAADGHVLPCPVGAFFPEP